MIREDAVFKMTENAQPASGDQEAAAGSNGKLRVCALTWLYLTSCQWDRVTCATPRKDLVQTAGTEQGNKAVQMQNEEVVFGCLSSTRLGQDPLTRIQGKLRDSPTLLGAFPEHKHCKGVVCWFPLSPLNVH